MTKSIPGILLVLLLAILVLQWRSWPPPVNQAVPTRAQAPSTASNASASADLDLLDKINSLDDKDSYASLIERPLFRPDRRPLPPEDQETEEPTGPDTNVELDRIDLTAVLITPTLTSAWIKDPAQPKLQRLRIGDEYASWTVKAIEEDRVLLERQGERHALILRDYSQAPPSSSKPVPVRQRPLPVRARQRPTLSPPK